eukprot:TRINITY_DN30388_c0_g1_i1.p1 TRINITY_DN30388_c0_g1~~TRINITY_DN30388_c0_g1_i1.p1  ORF type:complete len:389 (-),score=71.54 TRINITY_DN30388_c0_g1_i1:63-1229(-)
MGCNSSSGAKKSAYAVPDPETQSCIQGRDAAQASEEEVEEEEEEAPVRSFYDGLEEGTVIDMCRAEITGGTGCMFSIGSQTEEIKLKFEEKNIEHFGDNMDPESVGLGFACRKGLKPEGRECPNQDSWIALRVDEEFSIYGVFDGHGQKGHDVSDFVKHNLPKMIIRDKRFLTAEMPEMLKCMFRRMQSFISIKDREKELTAQLSGTTATVAIHDHKLKRITVAHVADSTCVLGVKSKDSETEVDALQVTRDHKPDLQEERARIEKAGGRVVYDGYANYRVYAQTRRYPGLNMSRCLGDLLGHVDCGISCEPEVRQMDLTEQDQILLLCSDGVWEFTAPGEAVTVVAKYPKSKAMTAASTLAKHAWDKWIEEEDGAVVDDITVVLIHL